MGPSSSKIKPGSKRAAEKTAVKKPTKKKQIKMVI